MDTPGTVLEAAGLGPNPSLEDLIRYVDDLNEDVNRVLGDPHSGNDRLTNVLVRLSGFSQISTAVFERDDKNVSLMHGLTRLLNRVTTMQTTLGKRIMPPN